MAKLGEVFKKRFKEHTPTNQTNIKNSHFAQHIVNTGHSCFNCDTNLKPLHICKKGRYMDAYEEFEIYKAAKHHPENLLNEKLIIKESLLFNTALKLTERT